MERIPEYIVVTNTPGYVDVDPSLDPDFADLLDQQKKRTLPKPHSKTTIASAVMFADEGMLMEEIWDEDTNTVKKVFKKAVVVAEGDAQGRVRVPKDKPEVARKLLRIFNNLGRKPYLDDMGLQLPETDPNAPPKNLGGRPPRKDK